jgi:glycosyltransferase involved in cell wall biosynthesis
MALARIAVICGDRVGSLMAGPAIRAVELATALSNAGHQVVLAAPEGSDSSAVGVSEMIVWATSSDIREAVVGCEIVVIFAPVLANNMWLASTGCLLVVDAYDPGLLETLESRRGQPVNAQRDWITDADSQMLAPMTVADVVIVANERQRHFVLGLLAGAGRLGSRTLAEDPQLNRLVITVPFGMPSDPPGSSSSPLRHPLGPFGDDAFVALWGGGLYSWLDPVALVEAVAVTADKRVVAAFLAGPHPTPAVGEMPLVEVAKRRARELGLLGSRVHFVAQWVPYAERGDWLQSADVGVSLHHLHVETELSYRTRMLDYLWAGLPVICTSGDVIAEDVARLDLGWVVAEGDVEGIARALDDACRETNGSADQRRARIERTAHERTWPIVTKPLIEVCADTRLAPDRRNFAAPGAARVGRLGRLKRMARGG